MDIDTDFAPSIRSKVIDYVSQKYAYRNEYPIEELKGTVCGIFTEGALGAKSAIRYVGKVTGVSIADCDKIAKMVPFGVNVTLTDALRDGAQLRLLYETDAGAKKLIDDALLVEGTPVQTGVHAAGVIIADAPVSEYAPLFWNEEKQMWVIQYDMIACESDLGLLKMDFLGLRNLDIIMRAKSYIWRVKGDKINFEQVGKAEDASVISKVYAEGKTNGIFQFESAGMKDVLKSFQPNTIDDVILLNAAYRPGPMQFIPTVTNVKFGKKTPKYIVPELASILDATYGSPIYQEQIQQIFHEIAGFSLGQADIIRRAMSKKHLDELEAAKENFVNGFLQKGANLKDVESFWTELLEFAKYAFNKSHAAAYSIVSYYTAWLKHYYPVEYMAALMSYTQLSEIAPYVQECRENNITILPPDVNASIVYTAATKSGNIRLGLEGIKSVANTAQKIIEERTANGAFTSIEDFLIRCAKSGIDKTSVIALAKVGALDEINLNGTRKSVVLSLDTENAASSLLSRVKKMLTGTGNQEEIDNVIKAVIQAELSSTDEYPADEKLKLEKENIGFYLSGHPLDAYKAAIDEYTARDNLSDIKDFREGQAILAVGRISESKIIYTKKDHKAMFAGTFEDATGTAALVCFPRDYQSVSHVLVEGNVVALKGKVTLKTDDDGNVTDAQIMIQEGTLVPIKN